MKIAGIKGWISDIDYSGPTAYLLIESEDGKRYRASQNRIANAPCGHRCLVRAGDKVTFTVNSENRITEVRLVTQPDCRVEEDEVSVVLNIENNMIFGKRIVPDCGCPIFIGERSTYPEIDVGMVVSHNLGKFNHRAKATNLCIGRMIWLN